MERATRGTGRSSGCVLALIGVAAGVAVFVLMPVVGWVLGPLIVLVSVFWGGRRNKALQCPSCTAQVPRE